MESLKNYLVQTCGLSENEAEGVCLTAVLERPAFKKFVQTLALVIQMRKEETTLFRSSLLAWEAYRIFISCIKGEAPANQKILSAFSNLSLSEGFLSTGSRTTSSSGQGPPLIPQDKGNEALSSSVNGLCFPELASDDEAEALWPYGQWKSVLSDTVLKCEGKFKGLIDKLQTIHMLREDVKSVFVRGTSNLCKPKIPDFALVDKNYQDTPTPETVGALLFAQSTSETESYSAAAAVGEAIACGQIFLRNSSQQRNFVLVGVTNLKSIRWFKVQRPGATGEFCGCRDVETSSIRHNLAGYMLCPPDKLGISVRSITTNMGCFRLGQWLGEGATSNVYDVCINNKKYAVKVAKEGHNLSSDVKYLTELNGIKGIPMILSDYSDPRAVFMTPVCQEFDLKLLEGKKLKHCLSEIVDMLQIVHGRLIVNRDVRMQNIVIAGDHLLIVDWGYAAPLQEAASFSGTTYYASDKVLSYLEEGSYHFVFNNSDDLVSLVRSLYILSRLTSSAQKTLNCIDHDDYAKIRRFWLEQFQDSIEWFQAEKLAAEGRYTDLKCWLLKSACF